MLGLLGVIGALFAGFMADGMTTIPTAAGRIGIVVIIGFGGAGSEYAVLIAKTIPEASNNAPQH